jgi:hypothetical protein
VISYREQAALALRAVAVRSPTSYAWFGHASRPLPLAVRSALSAGAAREFLIAGLAEELYRSFYSPGAPVPHRPRERSSARSDPGFVNALSAANGGSGGWQPGWRVEAVEGPTLQLVRNQLGVRAGASECRWAGGDGRPAHVSVRRPKEHRAASPGHYIAVGDADQADDPDAIEVRLYFNLMAAGAARLVAIATRLLNDEAVPFSLKILDHPASFSRCDAAVLYLRDGDFVRVQGLLRECASACVSHLRGEVPPFTKRLTAGIGVGEHRPSFGASFGTSRCRVLAEGIVVAHEHGATRLSDRLDHVAGRFAERRLNLDVPYLVAGSTDRYAL